MALLISTRLLYAFEVETHEAINESIAKGNMNGFSLDSYLRSMR